jgi:hypothetical protein
MLVIASVCFGFSSMVDTRCSFASFSAPKPEPPLMCPNRGICAGKVQRRSAFCPPRVKRDANLAHQTWQTTNFQHRSCAEILAEDDWPFTRT